MQTARQKELCAAWTTYTYSLMFFARGSADGCVFLHIVAVRKTAGHFTVFDWNNNSMMLSPFPTGLRGC